MYTIEFQDGSKLTGLTRNSGFYMTPAKLTREFFDGKLNGVKISSSDPTDSYDCGTHAHMRLVTIQDTRYITGLEDGTYFVLEDIPESEIARERLNANVEYIAMMSDIDLEA